MTSRLASTWLSVFRPVNPQGWAIRAYLARHRNVQAIAFGIEEARPRQFGHRDLVDDLEAVGVALLDDREITRATTRVEALALGIEEQIVDVAGNVDGRELLVGVVADIVGIRQLDRLQQLIVPAAEDIADAVRAVADEDAVQARGVSDTLDLVLVGNLLDELAGRKIDDIEAVVGEVGEEEP